MSKMIDWFAILLIVGGSVTLILGSTGQIPGW